MTAATTSAFDLPARLAAKADPTLIADDERHFSAIARTLEESIVETSDRLAAARRSPGRSGTAALERDQQIHRMSARLRTLRRFGLDLCLGRMVPDGGADPVYVGRLGLTDATGRRLLVDWRSPAAEPFFAATHGEPMGLASRRRYRWSRGRITDYWDEVFTPDELDAHAALDDQSAFIASLGSSRSPRMRDVLGTIQADQDAIIRAGSGGALVVDGGPGTGKTVVALHRAAYLVYSDPQLGHRRGGVLFVGPHRPYLNYIADVLPSLGEEGVQACTLRDLVPEGAEARHEADPTVARLKSTADMVSAIDSAVAIYEEPPTDGLVVETPWEDVWFDADDWARAFEAPEPGTPHNEARETIWDEVVAVVAERHEAEVPVEQVSASVRRNRELAEALNRAWPMLEASDLVADLWEVPAYLRLCAPWLSSDERRLLRRPDPRAWTDADLPLLDAARRRLGDQAPQGRRRSEEAAATLERQRRADVIEDLVHADDSDLLLMRMLRGTDMQQALTEEAALPRTARDLLAGPFAHIVVDEAQELTDAEWQMLLARCPSRSFTIVGDRAQARHGFGEPWTERLTRIGFGQVRVSSLSVNYRTPEEVMTAAEPVIRTAVADANVPSSVRSTGLPVRYGSSDELGTILEEWLSEHVAGTACVVGDPTFVATDRVRSLSPAMVKGLEFDLVILIEPASFGAGVTGAVDQYVAMTRATQQLVILRA